MQGDGYNMLALCSQPTQYKGRAGLRKEILREIAKSSLTYVEKEGILFIAWWEKVGKSMPSKRFPAQGRL